LSKGLKWVCSWKDQFLTPFGNWGNFGNFPLVGDLSMIDTFNELEQYCRYVLKITRLIETSFKDRTRLCLNIKKFGDNFQKVNEKITKKLTHKTQEILPVF
jgi:hypothetical protein